MVICIESTREIAKAIEESLLLMELDHPRHFELTPLAQWITMERRSLMFGLKRCRMGPFRRS
jgi:hypothetical protein